MWKYGIRCEGTRPETHQYEWGGSGERKLEGSDITNKHEAFILDEPVGRKESEGQKTIWTGSWTEMEFKCAREVAEEPH